jgi:hypothetical protein
LVHAFCELGPDDNHSSITALHKQQEDKLPCITTISTLFDYIVTQASQQFEQFFIT